MLFTSNVVNQVLKTNQPELSQWIVRGFVKPTQPAMGGTGTRNLYSAETVCQIQIFLDLSECGLRRPVASTIAFDTDILRIIGEIVEGAKVKNLLAPGIYLSVVRKPEKWQAIVIRGTGEMLSL